MMLRKVNCTLVIGILTLIQSPAHALPSVGDEVKIQVKVVVDNVTQFEGIETQSLTDYNAEKNQFLKKSVNSGSFFGNDYRVVPLKEEWVSVDNLASAEAITDYLKECGTGHLGEMTTTKVNDTVLQVCKESMANAVGTTLYGMVPFGWVGYDYTLVREGANIAVNTRVIDFTMGPLPAAAPTPPAPNP